ncbi:MAG: capsular polysaccharide export protein, LipB/KpsS family [Panacagrimonas sp.]
MNQAMLDAADPPRTLALIDLGIKAAPFFAELRHALKPDIRCVYYSRLAVVRSVLQQSGAECFPVRLSLPEAASVGADQLREVIGEKALISEPPRLVAQAARLWADLDAFLARQRAAALLVWNGSGLIASIAVHLARRRGLPVIFGENGYLPGTLQLDPQGVNQHSSITRLVREGRAELPAERVLDAQLDRALDDFRAGRTPKFQSAPKSLRPDWRSRLRREALRLVQPDSWVIAPRLSPKDFPDRLELPPRFVLLPFQVSQDSQLILHSPLVRGDMRLLLAEVHGAMRRADPRMELVVKLHPAESRQVLGRYRDLPRQYPDVRFTLRHPLTELLARCAAVVTINSTVGFEGIMFDRPVVTLGRNFYCATPLVVPVERLEDLESALAIALTEPPDPERRRAFLRYVYFRFLTHGSYRDFSDASFRAVAERIIELTGVPA